VTQSNSDNKTELICTIIINESKQEYVYAFIAVIILIILFFCCCPICCVYYYCRYLGGNEMYKNSKVYNYTNKNKNVNNYNNKNNNKNDKNATTGGTANNNCDGDPSYDQNEDNMALFASKTVSNYVPNLQEVECQPIYNTSNMEDNNEKDGCCATNANDEIVV